MLGEKVLPCASVIAASATATAATAVGRNGGLPGRKPPFRKPIHCGKRLGHSSQPRARPDGMEVEVDTGTEEKPQPAGGLLISMNVGNADR